MFRRWTGLLPKNITNLLQQVRDSYNDKDVSDFKVTASDGELFLRKEIISTVEYFRIFCSTNIGNSSSNKNEITVESIKTVDPIFKYLYGYIDNEITDQLDSDFSVDELLEFFRTVLFFMVKDMYNLIIYHGRRYYEKILTHDINNCHILYTMFDTISDEENSEPRNLTLLKVDIFTYLGKNINALPKDFIDTDLFKIFNKQVQTELIFKHECYELMNNYIEYIDSKIFDRYRNIFEKLCSLEQLSHLTSYLRVKSDTFTIVSIYPEFELQIKKYIGDITDNIISDNSIELVINSSSSLSVGDYIEINYNKHRVEKILYKDKEVTKIYPNLKCTIFIGKKIYEACSADRNISIKKIKILKN